MNILITGGTGFIGQHFIKSLSKTDKIIILSRQKRKAVENLHYIEDVSALPDDTPLDCIINLAGSPIDRRWTAFTKKDLMQSRLTTTKALIHLINRLKQKPSVFLSASAIGYYGNHNQATLDENASPIEGFTHTLCQAWETAALQAEAFGTRVCLCRFGVVLGENGGFIQKVRRPFRLGLGGKLGNGQQYFSWVHIADVIRAMHFLIQTPQTNGAYNIVSPQAVTNAELTKALGKALHRPTICTLPAPLIKLLFGEMGKHLLLEGNHIVPKRLRAAGFEFTHPNLDTALQSILAPPKAQ